MSFNNIVSKGISSNGVIDLLTDILHSQGVSTSNTWIPTIDITDSPKLVCIYVDIPGVDPDSLNIDFFNNIVHIKGERPKQDEEIRFLRREIRYGKFERKITLPISVTNNGSVTVRSEHGVLTIIINKECEARNWFSVSVTK